MRITNALSLSLIRPPLLAANSTLYTSESFLIGTFKPTCMVTSSTFGLDVASCEEAMNLVVRVSFTGAVLHDPRAPSNLYQVGRSAVSLFSCLMNDGKVID